MGYVATKHLKWGEETIAPGEAVPEGEEGRDYASLLRTGHIAETRAAEEMGDEELVAEVERLTKQVEELTAPVTVPDDVTPGETPGWPVDEDGQPYALPEPVRQRLGALEVEVAELRAQPGSEETGEQGATADAGNGSEEDPSTEGDDEATEAASGSAAPGLPEGVKALGGGFYEMPDGSKVRGRKAVEKALADAGNGSEE